MFSFAISYSVFVLLILAAGVLAALLCFYAAHCRRLHRDKVVTERAYSELVAGSGARERQLLAELSFERSAFNTADLARKLAIDRCAVAESDADRLAAIVTQYLKDIDDTAELLKDASPPCMKSERAAIHLHAEAQNIRSYEKR